jgi:hypothetical protein
LKNNLPVGQIWRDWKNGDLQGIFNSEDIHVVVSTFILKSNSIYNHSKELLTTLLSKNSCYKIDDKAILTQMKILNY